MNVKENVSDIYAQAVSWRRQFHENPELSYEEKDTSGFIYEKLKEFGLDDVQYFNETSVVGILNGMAGAGRCIAIREDIDALPIQEATNLPYASKKPGIMHACGHDGHTAILLSVAKILSENREAFRGCVKFIFQKAEEKMPGGAIALVESGVLENPHVDAVMALHIHPNEKCGAIRCDAGSMSMGGTLVRIRVTGQGGHAAKPELANDVVLACSEYIVAVQQIVSRCISPSDSAVISACELKAGTAPNILPAEGYISLNPRYFTQKTKKVLLQKMKDIAEGIEKMSGCRFDMEFEDSYQPVENDPEMVEMLEKVCTEEMGIEFIRQGRFNGGDDFCYYTLNTGVPGIYFHLLSGCLTEQIYSAHSPGYNWDEEGMKTGIEALTRMVMRYLNLD